jgi:hypothetical protein
MTIILNKILYQNRKLSAKERAHLKIMDEKMNYMEIIPGT